MIIHAMAEPPEPGYLNARVTPDESDHDGSCGGSGHSRRGVR
jgi:hypothetical protein